MSSRYNMDNIDLEILRILQENAKASYSYIASKLKIPKPTVYYRVKKLESMGIIRSYRAILDPEKLGFEYITITLVRGRYGRGYHEKIGEALARYPYVQSVYFVLGDIDFVVLAKSPSREAFMKFLESMINSPEIERTSTLVVVKVIKEDLSLNI
ncbi:MAG: Lrp/AsnC family transcriptional regulator [Sulfolobales archaeon]